MESETQWWRLTDAAKALGVSTTKLSNMVKRGRIPSRKDVRDERVTLVDMIVLRQLFSREE